MDLRPEAPWLVPIRELASCDQRCISLQIHTEDRNEMKADILKLLLQSHADGDEASFRRAALQLAAAESSAGHVRVADEIRAIVAKMPPSSARKAGPSSISRAPGVSSQTFSRAVIVMNASATSSCAPRCVISCCV
jgi:hypothetical protein